MSIMETVQRDAVDPGHPGVSQNGLGGAVGEGRSGSAKICQKVRARRIDRSVVRWEGQDKVAVGSRIGEPSMKFTSL